MKAKVNVITKDSGKVMVRVKVLVNTRCNGKIKVKAKGKVKDKFNVKDKIWSFELSNNNLLRSDYHGFDKSPAF